MHPILENYIPVAKLISQTFGSHCEVIIHDFDRPQNSVVYTENNVVTNRAVGESFTEYFVKEVLLSRKFNNDCCANYIMEGKDGKKIKSSTALIRDLNGKVIGALCVNIDLSRIVQFMEDISTLLGMPDAIVPPAEEVDVVSSIREIVDDIIDRTIGDQDVESMSRDQKIALIRFMNDREIFTIKQTPAGGRGRARAAAIYSLPSGLSFCACLLHVPVMMLLLGVHKVLEILLLAHHRPELSANFLRPGGAACQQVDQRAGHDLHGRDVCVLLVHDAVILRVQAALDARGDAVEHRHEQG